MADSDNESGGHNGGEMMSAREQDRFLPIANVSRIMKKALPANAKISKDAKETVQECVSEFISFVTGEASDKCQREKRKTINGDDLLWAMTTLGFEEYVEPLKVYLAKYREMEGEKTNIAGGDSGSGGLQSPASVGAHTSGFQYQSHYNNNIGGGNININMNNSGNNNNHNNNQGHVYGGGGFHQMGSGAGGRQR
ncbi:hypothetical protein DCAR_0522504 [Daucus carota subsp. sativus]|uniref:Uncharacterized protein n=1 Tax=Daucus carota subsp. sativus TaxID=79200 RepID=A0A164ZUQ6_DAUCS|nr:PREDICTED: nuclear transcription factor Y subunit B-3-like [Daucus carota subsp. sativus]WOH03111.1 hypothetical protein DCAR_0522504 [Daucus carota subsp. sativus]